MTCQLVACEDREVFIGGLKESPPASHSLSLCSDLGADMLRTTPLDFLTMLLFIPELTSKFIKSKQRCQVTWLEDRNGVTGWFRLGETSRVFGPTSCSQLGQLGGQTRLLMASPGQGWKNLQGQRLHNISGNLVPLPDCHHEGNFYFISSLNLSCFTLFSLYFIFPSCPTSVNPAPSPRWSVYRHWGLLLGPTEAVCSRLKKPRFHSFSW